METKKPSKSQLIREMYEQGKSVSTIAKELGVNYAMAYQITQRYCESKGIKHTTNKDNVESKASIVRKLYREGLTIGEIAKQLNSNYSYIWSICDKERRGK